MGLEGTSEQPGKGRQSDKSQEVSSSTKQGSGELDAMRKMHEEQAMQEAIAASQEKGKSRAHLLRGKSSHAQPVSELTSFSTIGQASRVDATPVKPSEKTTASQALQNLLASRASTGDKGKRKEVSGRASSRDDGKDSEEAFKALSTSIHAEIKRATEERKLAAIIRDDFKATPKELSWGVFKEEIEPQVEKALDEFYDKGYTTYSSGFGEDDNIQKIDIKITLTEKIKQDLGRLNRLHIVDVEFKDMGEFTSIYFRPKKADVEEIEADWQKITECFPDTGKPAQPDERWNAKEFREKYGSDADLSDETFKDLSLDVKSRVDAAVAARKRSGREATPDELNRGVFDEGIEEQARDAFKGLYDKGYTIHLSGFDDEHHDTQKIEGKFTLDEKTKQEFIKLRELKGIDVKVRETFGGYTTISFRPKRSNVEAIKADWQKITECFPDMGKPAQPNEMPRAREFRRENAPGTHLSAGEDLPSGGEASSSTDELDMEL